MEAIVGYGLTSSTPLRLALRSNNQVDIPDSIPFGEDWLVSKWSFYKNDSLLSLTFDSTEFSTCGLESKFDSMYCTTDVKELAERTLFSSLKHNGALFDFMYVDHSKETVFVFQVSSLSADLHSLKAITVHKVMTGLHFFDQGNDNYRMKYIYCCKSNTKSLTRCTLTNGEEEIGEHGGTLLSPADLEAVKKRFEILIARIHFFPSDTPIILADSTSTTSAAINRNKRK
jgi:hypothetical protein